jgi:acyl carrier protein
MDPELGQYIARREAALATIRTILIEQLDYPSGPEGIDADAPLFGTGLGLDSVDALELVVAVETAFGIALPEPALRHRLRTLNTLVDLVLHQRSDP